MGEGLDPDSGWWAAGSSGLCLSFLVCTMGTGDGPKASGSPREPFSDCSVRVSGVHAVTDGKGPGSQPRLSVQKNRGRAPALVLPLPVLQHLK
jgi:hypothetical protein